MLMVVGCPRSGSHLLTVLLEQRADLAVPTEARFAPMFARWLWLAGNLGVAENRTRLAQAIYAFLYLWEHRNRSRNELAATVHYSLLSTADQLDALVAATHDYGGLVEGMYQTFGMRWNRAHSLEKITFINPLPLGSLDRHLSELKVVHILRDGRDVYASWRKVWFGVRSAAEAAVRWRRHVDSYRAWGRKHPQNYLEIRYEHLLEDTDKVCEQVIDFLGVPPPSQRSSDSFSASKISVLSRREGHQHLASTVNRSNIEKWREALSANELAEFEAFAAPTMKLLGYATESARLRRLAMLRAAARAVGLLFTSTISLRRFSLASLPPMLLLSSRLGLPFTRWAFERARCIGATGADEI